MLRISPKYQATECNLHALSSCPPQIIWCKPFSAWAQNWITRLSSAKNVHHLSPLCKVCSNQLVPHNFAQECFKDFLEKWLIAICVLHRRTRKVERILILCFMSLVVILKLTSCRKKKWPCLCWDDFFKRAFLKLPLKLNYLFPHFRGLSCAHTANKSPEQLMRRRNNSRFVLLLNGNRIPHFSPLF